MARGVGKKSDAARPPPQAWLANCLHPGARVVTAKDVVLAPVADHAGAEKEKKPRGGGRPRGAAPGGEPVDYAAHEVVPPPEGWRREVIPRKSVQGADAYYYSPCGKRMRSKPDVQRFLDKKRPEGKYTDVTIDQFDFSTQPRAVKAPKEEKPKKEGGGGRGGGGGGARRSRGIQGCARRRDRARGGAGGRTDGGRRGRGRRRAGRQADQDGRADGRTRGGRRDGRRRVSDETII